MTDDARTEKVTTGDATTDDAGTDDAATDDAATDDAATGTAIDEPQAPQRPVRRRRLAVTVLVWLVVAAFAIWAAVRLFGLERGFPSVQLVSFTPYVAAASVLVPVIAAVLRRWPAAAVATLAAAALIACVLPRWLADSDRLPSGPDLRVMTLNMRVGGADPATIVALVRDNHVDLLALQEYTAEAERGLAAAGLGELLPNRSSYPREAAGGSALYSRLPLRDQSVRLNPFGFAQATATVEVPGAAALAVESVHPCPPLAQVVDDCWARALADEPPATVDGQVRVLLGDYNATLDHAALRHLLRTGYRDAADVVGEGLSPTWPYDKLFPRITIDHVLADRRVGVRRLTVHSVRNTDHRAVVAELVLPAA
jgi:endonuclease/exonuclease/phosphatase (EEP) superfamily protein YafD